MTRATGRDKPGPGRGKKTESTSVTPFSKQTLSDLSVTPNQSSQWQRIASVPEKKFEAIDAQSAVLTSKSFEKRGYAPRREVSVRAESTMTNMKGDPR